MNKKKTTDKTAIFSHKRGGVIIVAYRLFISLAIKRTLNIIKTVKHDQVFIHKDFILR